MVQKTNSGPESKTEIEKLEALKKRAAKQANKRELAPSQNPTVECVVLPAGHEKISMGEHVPGLGEVHYEEGEPFTVELPIALALYRRGFVNFDGARDVHEADLERLKRDQMAAGAERIAQQKALEAAGL